MAVRGKRALEIALSVPAGEIEDARGRRQPGAQALRQRRRILRDSFDLELPRGGGSRGLRAHDEQRQGEDRVREYGLRRSKALALVATTAS